MGTADPSEWHADRAQITLRPVSRAPVRVLVTIDTEEDGLWSGEYRRQAHALTNLEGLRSLSAVLDACRQPGTYLVTWPVAADPKAAALVARAVEGGRGEVGSHLHSWSCPPHDPVEMQLPLYPHCLPPALQQAKLSELSGLIARVFGRAPVSYRAGRWGFGPSSIGPLLATGHRIDSSVVPGWWQKGRGAPQFAGAPSTPYAVDETDPLRPGASDLLEVPVTTGFVDPEAPLSRLAALIPPWLPGGRRARQAAGFTILRPALHDRAALLALVRAALAAGAPVLNLMLHSSEMAPGHSPYSRTGAERDDLLERVRAVLEGAGAEGAVPATLAAVALQPAEPRIGAPST